MKDQEEDLKTIL